MNVQTLDPGELRKLKAIGLQGTARMSFVDAYMHKRAVQLLGIQETRLPIEGITESQHFRIYSSPCAKDSAGGVQLWIHKPMDEIVTSPVCDPISPRLLKVDSSHCGSSFSAVVADAPCASEDVNTRRTFWKEFERALKRVKFRNRTIVFIDANDDDVGKGADANAFFADEQKMAFRLADVAQYVGNVKPTWFGIVGHEKVCDHIWAAKWWIDKLKNSDVFADSVSFAVREDHKPVWAFFVLNLEAAKTAHREPQLKLNTSQLDCQSHVEAFQNDLSERC